MPDRVYPLSVRERGEEARREYDALHEGVPEWLWPSIDRWMRGRFKELAPYDETYSSAAVRAIGRRLRRNATTFEELIAAMRADSDYCLDVLDEVLRMTDGRDSGQRDVAAILLDRDLSEAGSVWQAVHRSGWWRLERRVDETVAAMADQVIATATRPAEHLKLAWQSAWGRSPAASESYREAVRAVEAALANVVSPANPTATLGTIIKDIENKPSKFSMRLVPTPPTDAVSVLLDNLKLLWKSQLDRHGTPNTSIPLAVSIEQARDAVVLATTIVHWAQSGAFTTR